MGLRQRNDTSAVVVHTLLQEGLLLKVASAVKVIVKNIPDSFRKDVAILAQASPRAFLLALNL